MMFVDDINVKNGLLALILRASCVKGKIKKINAPPAPDNCFFLSAKDIPGKNKLSLLDIPILAESEISYFGEPVALLCGPERKTLENYARLCTLEIDEEEPELSLWNSEEEPLESSIFYKKEFVFQGRVKDGEKSKESGEAALVGNYETGIQEHWYSEPHGAVASFEKNRLVIKTAAQSPDFVKQSVINVLGITEDEIEIENFDLGIHFDGKLVFPALISALAALAAFKSGRTVKLQFNRQEDYLFSPKRTPSAISIKTVLNKDGGMLESKITLKVFLGAYGIYPEKTVHTIAEALMSVYKIPSLSINAYALKTNIPPAGPFAGFGASIASYALERHISKICDSLNEDGIEWRKSHIKAKLSCKDSASVINKLFECAANSKKSAYRRKWAVYELLRHKEHDKENIELILPLRGIGIAFALSREIYKKDNAQGTSAAGKTAAAAVVEVEIDRINYEAKVRGIWFCLAIHPRNKKERIRKIIRRSITASLGWTSTEKIKFENGRITPESCAFYQLLPVSRTPPIHIDFVEMETADDDAVIEDSYFEELPFSTIPAAYTQAISQAVNFHFSRIPITAQDVWRVMNLKHET